MVKAIGIKPVINLFAASPEIRSFAQKPSVVSIFTKELDKLKYVTPRLRGISENEVKSLFIEEEIGGRYLFDQMVRVKSKLLLASITDIHNFKKWMHSVSLKKGVSESDVKEVTHFMNMHNGRFLSTWMGFSLSDMIPNIEKLALFVRSIKRIDKLNFYKGLNENQWENCIQGIVNKPESVVEALMEYKYDSRKINNAISYGNGTKKIKEYIRRIEQFLNTQTLKHDMQAYRGEGNFGIFENIKIDNNTSLKDLLESFSAEIEAGRCSDNEIKEFIQKYLVKKYIIQKRFMSTAIEPEAIENYAKKVYWRIDVPAKTKASVIESYNVERESEAELLVQKGSRLLIKEAKYDIANKRWNLWASLEQPEIEKGLY